MIQIKSARDKQRLRRLLLSSQGLLTAAPFGRGLSGALKAVRHLGYVQIDTISVVERAHHHVLFNRVPGYQSQMLNKLLEKRSIFEYWAHAAAFLPVEDYRFSLPYKTAIKAGKIHWNKNPDKKLMNELVSRIKLDGPLRSRDVESGSKSRTGWWDWKPAKKALEQLYMQGDLMVSSRHGFQKTYDLTERVLPDNLNLSLPDKGEFAQYLLDQHLRSVGLASLKGLTYLRRDAELRSAVKALVEEKVYSGELEQIQWPDGEIHLIKAGALESAMARANNRVVILSPFDNSVIQRARTASVFNFDFQLECFLPAHKRQFGYFCLPLLYKDSFVGRMDCKANRKTKVLEIKSLHLQLNSSDLESFLPALQQSVAIFRDFHCCRQVHLQAIYPQGLKPKLLEVIAQLNSG